MESIKSSEAKGYSGEEENKTTRTITSSHFTWISIFFFSIWIIMFSYACVTRWNSSLIYMWMQTVKINYHDTKCYLALFFFLFWLDFQSFAKWTCFYSILQIHTKIKRIPSNNCSSTVKSFHFSFWKTSFLAITSIQWQSEIKAAPNNGHYSWKRVNWLIFISTIKSTIAKFYKMRKKSSTKPIEQVLDKNVRFTILQTFADFDVEKVLGLCFFFAIEP